MWLKNYNDNSYWNSKHITALAVQSNGSNYFISGSGAVFTGNIATEAEAQAVLKKLATILGCFDVEGLI